jgi:hypothetical protein
VVRGLYVGTAALLLGAVVQRLLLARSSRAIHRDFPKAVILSAAKDP